MPEAPSLTTRMRASLVLVATLATITFNWFAAMGLVNGVTPATIAERNPSLITPASYAFSIWSLIYLWMIAFSLYQLLPANIRRFGPIRTPYLASCLLNIAWIWFWHRGHIATCLVLIGLLAAVLLLINDRLKTSESVRDTLFTKAPFGIYFGWVTCAALINLNILAASLVDSAALALAIGVVSTVFAAAAAVFVCWRLDNYFYPLAVAWALTAIAVKQSGNTPIVLAAAFATVVCLVTAGSVVTKLKDSTSE